jgi:hypothetical protein
MNGIRQMIFSGWHFMRILRLVFGVFMAANAIMLHDTLAGMIASIFLFQAFTNTGCCSASCAVPIAGNNSHRKSEAVFEEIK